MKEGPMKRNTTKDESWKDRLPEDMRAFLDGTAAQEPLSKEEEDAIARQMYQNRCAIDRARIAAEEAEQFKTEPKAPERKALNVGRMPSPQSERAKWIDRLIYINRFAGIWLGMSAWIAGRVAISFTRLHANQLTDFLTFFGPITYVTYQNCINYCAGERDFKLLSVFTRLNDQKWEERRYPLSERQLRNPLPPQEIVRDDRTPMFFFGKSGLNYIGRREEDEGHILCIGGSGSGKSSCVAIPTLYTWDGPLFAIDIKGELSENAPYRHNNYVIDPFQSESYGYDPFEILKSYSEEDIVHGIQDIVFSIIPDDGKDHGGEKFWEDNARSYLSGIYLWGFRNGKSFTALNEMICGQDARETMEAIQKSCSISHIATVMLYLGGFVKMNDKTLDCIVSTAKAAVELFAVDKTLKDTINREKKVIPRMLLEGARIFLKIPEEMIEPWRPYLNMITQQFLRECSRFPDGGGQHVLLMIDEFARLGRIKGIENSMATLRSKGCTVCLLTQSISQIDAIYGEQLRRVIVDNAAYDLIFSVSDTAGQEEIAKMIGKGWFTLESDSDAGELFKKRYSRHKEHRYKVEPESLRDLGDKLIVIGKKGFCRVEKVPYYKPEFVWRKSK